MDKHDKNEKFLRNVKQINRKVSVQLRVCVCVSRLVMSNSLQPMDSSLVGFSVHGILLVRITGVGCRAFLQGDLPD